jgi:CBS domain-containing protein
VFGGFGGLWTAFIGWFLRNAATAEVRFASLNEDLGGVTARDIMTAAQPVEGDWLSVAAFIDRHAIQQIRPFYLVGGTDGPVSGVVTVKALTSVPNEDRWTTSVRTVARSVGEYPAVRADEPAAELLRKIGTAPFVVVWEGSNPIGTITQAQFATAAETAQMLASLRTVQADAA